MKVGQTENVWTRRFWILLGAVTGLRIAYLAVFPYDLVGDEAYYWDWGRQLAWGYFSKPPMIGWLMGLFDWLGGGSLAGIKFAPILFGVGTAIWLFLLTRRMYGARAGFWVGALMMASIGNVALNVLFTIDAPLLFCWTGALYVFWRLVEMPEGKYSRAGWAVALVLLLGCGVLSKQMMLAFWGMGLIFLALDKPSRRFLKHPGTWIVALVALLFLLPPLWWNWQNDWITFVHMEDHFQPGKTDIVEILLRPLVFIGVQIALGSPITGVLLFGLLMALVFARGPCERRVRYLLTFSVPGLIVVLLMSLRQNINANWPAVYFPAAYILLGAWGVGALSTGKGFERLRWLFKPGVYLGAGLAVLAYAMPFVIKAGGWEGEAKDPGRRMEGWSEAGKQAGAFYADFPGDKPELVIAGGHRHTAAEFAFYLPDQPRVYRWFPHGHVESQYEIWGGPAGAQGKNALILWPGEVETLPPDLQSAFGKTRYLGAFAVQPNTKNAKVFTAFAGIDFKEWKP